MTVRELSGDTTRNHLTRHKISDREPCKARQTAEVRMANTHKVERSLPRGSVQSLP